MLRDEIGLRRQWALLRRLSARAAGWTLRELAGEFAVTERTLRRDLDTFRSVGFPIREESGEFGRKCWRMATTRELPPLEFSYDEAVALHLGRRLLGPLAGTPFEEAADNAFRKIRSTLGPTALDYLQQFASFFHVVGAEPRDYHCRSDCVDALLMAVEECRSVRLVYRSEGSPEATPRDVQPRGLIEHRGALYLVAFDPAASRVKHYKVDRVESAEVGGPSPAESGDFDLAAHMAEAFGVYRGVDGPVIVRVRFGPEAARYIREATHHARRKLVDDGDGGVIAEYLVSGTEEIKRWILGFGVKAVVLEPESLRREVAAELRATLVAYEDPSPAVAVTIEED
jgi:proteasome accessory factor B